MSRYQKIRNVLLTVIVTLALQCTFEICLGGYVDSNLVNGLNKLCGAFTVLDYTDLLTAAAVFVMLKEVKKREAKTDVATLVLSVILSFLLIVCISFKKYDSAIFLWGNSFQILLSTFCVIVSGIAPGIFWAGACGITRRAGQKAPTDGGIFCNSLQLAVLDPAKLSGNYQWGRSGATETVSG